MSEGDNRYRVWLAGEATWEPGPEFSQLALAIDRARRLAVTKWVAIELPSREWHVFDESQTTRLGPPQFARGSNLDLNDRAAAASEESKEPEPKKRSREFPRASTGNSSYRISGVRITRPARAQKNPDPSATASGLGPETTHRAPGSRTTGPMRAQTAPSADPPRRLKRSTMREMNERRAAERYAADEVLGEPACYLEGQRAEVIDVSETGLQLVMPPRIRMRPGVRTVLTFADRHGRFDLAVKAVWCRAGHVGVEIEAGGVNTVGKMFLRKLINQLVAKRERQSKLKLGRH